MIFSDQVLVNTVLPSARTVTPSAAVVAIPPALAVASALTISPSHRPSTAPLIVPLATDLTSVLLPSIRKLASSWTHRLFFSPMSHAQLRSLNSGFSTVRLGVGVGAV